MGSETEAWYKRTEEFIRDNGLFVSGLTAFSWNNLCKVGYDAFYVLDNEKHPEIPEGLPIRYLPSSYLTLRRKELYIRDGIIYTNGLRSIVDMMTVGEVGAMYASMEYTYRTHTPLEIMKHLYTSPLWDEIQKGMEAVQATPLMYLYENEDFEAFVKEFPNAKFLGRDINRENFPEGTEYLDDLAWYNDLKSFIMYKPGESETRDFCRSLYTEVYD